MDEAKLNQVAWDEEVKRNNFWTREESREEVERAKNGILNVRLTPHSYVKRSWLEDVKGKDVLLLASSGGQQTLLFSAAGARVTAIDISPKMVRKDEEALKRYGLKARTIVGDMRDLGMLDSESFDLVFIPHSINFISSLEGLYCQVSRVLKDNGSFMLGTANPLIYLFDERKIERGKLKVRYTIPFSDEKSKSRKEREEMVRKKDTFEYSHSLKSILEPLFSMGFSMKDFYSDFSDNDLIDSFLMDSYLAFNFVKIRL